MPSLRPFFYFLALLAAQRNNYPAERVCFCSLELIYKTQQNLSSSIPPTFQKHMAYPIDPPSNINETLDWPSTWPSPYSHECQGSVVI